MTDITAMKSHGSLKHFDSSVLQALENMHTRLSVLEDRYLKSEHDINPASDDMHAGSNPASINMHADSNPASEAAPSAAQLARILHVHKFLDDALWIDYNQTELRTAFIVNLPNHFRRNELADEVRANNFLTDSLGQSIPVDMWKREFLRVSVDKVDSRRRWNPSAVTAGLIVREVFSRALRLVYPADELGDLMRDLRTD